jgi:hypothetical protein
MHEDKDAGREWVKKWQYILGEEISEIKFRFINGISQDVFLLFMWWFNKNIDKIK